MNLYYFWNYFTLIAFFGCASYPQTKIEKVNDRNIEYAMTQHNTIPIVFENGLGGSLQWWKEVLPEIADDSTSFVYNRPGIGSSEPTSSPRDGVHIVDELRFLLLSKGLNPPYILVGHSLGGLYMQVFARKYPQEVKALILVDSTHPKQLEGESALENQSWWVRFILDATLNNSGEEELNLLSTTGDQVLILPTLKNKQVIVLSAAKPLLYSSKLADDANQKRKDIANLYPGSKQIWVESGHGIPLEKPESIISAIREAQKNQP
jgi:pimeloyl-ACP methyl ester carboxylesterase